MSSLTIFALKTFAREDVFAVRLLQQWLRQRRSALRRPGHHPWQKHWVVVAVLLVATGDTLMTVSHPLTIPWTRCNTCHYEWIVAVLQGTC